MTPVSGEVIVTRAPGSAPPVASVTWPSRVPLTAWAEASGGEKEHKMARQASAAVWAEQGWQGKVAAAFTNSAGVNGDKLNTLTSMAVLAAQHGMHG